MQKIVLTLFCFLFSTNLFCQAENTNKIEIIDFIDNDDIKDTLVQLDSTIEITTKRRKYKFKIEINEVFGTSIGINKKGSIYTITSGTGMGRVENYNLFDYDENVSNWVYTKSIEIFYNFDYGIEPLYFEYTYNDSPFVSIMGEEIEYNLEKPKAQTITAILDKVKKNKNVELEILEYIYNYAINPQNLIIYNDIAYYLKESAIGLLILEDIIKKFPNRIVAYLNLADNYYSLGNELKAKKNYLIYIKLMKEQNKDLTRIPDYVYERLKE